MKTLALLSLALSLSSGPVMAGPFGLNIGQSISELRVLKHNADGSYQVSVPAPDSEFRSYFVFTSGEGAICDVVAVGSNRDNRLLAAYASVKNDLTQQYGRPTNDLDFCKDATGGSSYCFLGSNASPFKVPLELKMNMLVLRATWLGSHLTDHIERISLSPYADSLHEAHLIVSFEGKNGCPRGGPVPAPVGTIEP